MALRIEADGSHEHGGGSLEPPQLLQCATKVEEQTHVVRPVLHQPLEDSHGCLVLSLPKRGIGRRDQDHQVGAAG